LEEPFLIETFVSLLLLLLLSLFSGAEAVLSAVSRSSLERMKEEGVRYAGRVLRIYQPRRKLQLTIEVGKSISLVGSTATLLLMALKASQSYGAGYPAGISAGIALAIVLGLFFENVVPRMMLISEPERSIPRFGFLLQILYVILKPLVHLAYWMLGAEIDSKEAKEELKNIVEFESEEGVIEEEKKEMISGIFEFSDTTVKEVMVPRIDMVCVEITTGIEDIIRIVQEAGFSRIPIYRETIDNIEGILYAKDLLKLLVEPKREWNIKELMREPYFVPENKKIDEMMREFKRRKIHIAIVVDEYGGTAGLITLEDLLEEIVGEIQDEYDIEEEQLYHWIDGDTLVADARIDIHDLNEAINSDLPDEGFETLAGLIYSKLGSIPAKGETLEVDNLKFIIEDVNGHRISKVRIIKNRSGEDSARDS